MTPSSRAQPLPERPFAEALTPGSTGAFASLVSTILLAVLLITGPTVLGAARLWIELPLLGVVAVLFFIQGLRLSSPTDSGTRRPMDAIDAAVILFVVYALIRWLTSPTEYFSRLEILNVVAYAVVFFTCRYGIVRRVHALALLGLLVALGFGETCFGYYLHKNPDFFPFGPNERLQLYYAPRWVGTYGCPDHYAGLLVMALAATLAFACFSKLSWPLRIVLFYAAGVMMVGVFFALSRGGWLALLAALIALMIFGLRYGTLRWWIPVSAALVLIVFFAGEICFSPDAYGRIQEMSEHFHNGRMSHYVRLELAGDALRIARDYPAFGTGPGTFVFIHPRYQGPGFAYKAIFTHDDYLNCLDDYGLVGFALAMLFVTLVTLRFLRPMPADNRWQDRVLKATGFAAWSALLIHSLVDFNLHIPANAFVLFALTGLGLRAVRGEPVDRHWSLISLAPLGRWLGWSLIVCSLLYGVQVLRTGMSDSIYETAAASALEVPTDQSIQGANDALTFDKGNAQALTFLGDLYRYRASRLQTLQGRSSEGQKALEAYGKALAANPLDDTIEARMGMTFDIMRRYSEAFFCYKAAATARPYDGQIWNALGNHFWQRGLLEKAEEAYLMAMSCPHGNDESSDAVVDLRKILDARGVPPPAPGTNPLLPKPEAEEPPTTP